MKKRLLQFGVFPETLPPCFTSSDLPRALRGLTASLLKRRLEKRGAANWIRYSGTKHDGSRRLYGTPHLIPYYYTCDFITRNWQFLSRAFQSSPYTLSAPRPAPSEAERSIVVTPLSEVASHVSKKIGHAPWILRADIAQFYPGLYTHAIPWAAHGKAIAKRDTKYNSKKVRFNQLDFFIRNVQSGQTRGLLIGPDAYRIVAELVAVKVDELLRQRAEALIIGAARHVDDFYIGVRSELDATVVLSLLRDACQDYELQLNDLKTRIIPSISQLDEAWAPRLRLLSREIQDDRSEERITNFFTEAIEIARQVGTQSPVKLAIRRADQYRLYEDPVFSYIEPFCSGLSFIFPTSLITHVCWFRSEPL